MLSFVRYSRSSFICAASMEIAIFISEIGMTNDAVQLKVSVSVVSCLLEQMLLNIENS